MKISSGLVALATLLAAPCATAAHADAPVIARPQERADAEIEEYRQLFVGLAEDALRQPRLAAPMPCLTHWLAAIDHVVVAVSSPAVTAGLRRGDRLTRVGDRALTGVADAVWDVAMRILSPGLTTFAVDVSRAGKTVTVTLPCAPDQAELLHRAERGLWMAVAHRDWNACVDRGREMIQAFGADFSPPLMLMTRCIAATRAGAADPALTNRLALALLDELVAHPKPSPDLREQLFLTLRDLEMIRRAGGEDFATALREKMNASGVNIPGAKDR